jgi:ABC-type sulfate transport system substrate-binding protein
VKFTSPESTLKFITGTALVLQNPINELESEYEHLTRQKETQMPNNSLPYKATFCIRIREEIKTFDS